MSTPASTLGSRPRGGAVPAGPHRHGTPDGAGGAGALRRPKGAEGAKRPPRSQPRPATTPKPIRRPKHHVAFAILASTLIGVIVFAVVLLHALLAQQSFRIEDTERRIEALEREGIELVTQQATLSAPRRIAAWAERLGMRLPDDIRILRAPNGPVVSGGADPVSEHESSP